MRRIALSLLVAAGLSTGCSNLRSIDIGQGDYWVKSARPLTRSESLLLYFDYAHGLSAAELARENETLRQTFAGDKSDFTRLRYALLLAATSAGLREHGRAQQLLEPVTRDAAGRDPAMRALASLLITELAERRRLEDERRRLDEERRRLDEERRRLDDGLQAATQRHKEEQLRAADLEQKLEALKEIEKTLGGRERKALRPGPASGGAGK